MQVTLRKITPENVWDILNLKVAPDQANFVASNEKSLAQARLDDKAWYRGIYAGDDTVGFVMVYQNPEGKEPAYFLWRLMIAQDHQGKGYGKQAMEQVIGYVKKLPGAYRLGVSYVPGPGCPQEFYTKLGFVPTGEVHEGEIEMFFTWGQAPHEGPDLTLRPVTSENLKAIAELKVESNQKDWVISNIDSIAEALVYPHLKTWGIYLGDEPIGFAMLEENCCTNTYFLWRLMIAQGFQGKGYGRQALDAIVAYLYRRTNAQELRTSCKAGPNGPEGFYRGAGFAANGELLDDEIVLVKNLQEL